MPVWDSGLGSGEVLAAYRSHYPALRPADTETMPFDVATITAMGTAIATVILSIGPLVRAFRERGPEAGTALPGPVAPLNEAIITTLRDEMR